MADFSPTFLDLSGDNLDPGRRACRRRYRSSIPLHQVYPFTFEVRNAAIGDVLDVFYAGPLQKRSGHRATDSPGAGDSQRLVGVPDLVRHFLAQLLVGDVYGALDVPRLPFGLIPYVEENDLFFVDPLGQARHVERGGRLHLQPGCAPGVDPTGKVTPYVPKTNSLQQADRPLRVLVPFGSHDDLGIGV